MDLLLYLLIRAIVAAGLPGMLVFAMARWFLGQGGRPARIVLTLVVAALGVGVAYGVLRLSGLVLLPDDNTYSINLFDASWRDDGVFLLLAFGGPIAGIAAALFARPAQKREEDMNHGKQPD